MSGLFAVSVFAVCAFGASLGDVWALVAFSVCAFACFAVAGVCAFWVSFAAVVCACAGALGVVAFSACAFAGFSACAFCVCATAGFCSFFGFCAFAAGLCPVRNGHFLKHDLRVRGFVVHAHALSLGGHARYDIALVCGSVRYFHVCDSFCICVSVCALQKLKHYACRFFGVAALPSAQLLAVPHASVVRAVADCLFPLRGGCKEINCAC